MKSLVLVFTGALAAAACGGQSKTAHDPSVVETTSAGTETTDLSSPKPSPMPMTAQRDLSRDVHTMNGQTAADQTPDADNTKINERDRSNATLTPMNQGNSRSETDITAAIRQRVVGEKSLSFTAKNVKIITVGSKVTLRGAVKSDQEKATIESFAKQTMGVTDVDDQIEVKK